MSFAAKVPSWSCFVIQSKTQKKQGRWIQQDVVLSAERNLRAMLVAVMQRVGRLSYVVVKVLRGAVVAVAELAVAAAYEVVGAAKDEERAEQLVESMLQWGVGPFADSSNTEPS